MVSTDKAIRKSQSIELLTICNDIWMSLRKKLFKKSFM